MVRPDSEARGWWRLGKLAACGERCVFEPGRAGRSGVDVLNCKQGDLAIIVRSQLGNAGRVVTCLRIASPENLRETFGSTMEKHGLIWRIDTPVKWSNWVRGVVEVPFMADEVLRPLRDSEGEDEMLRLVGKPADSLVGA